MENKFIESVLTVLALFGAFVLGAMFFTDNLLEKNKILEGANNYLNTENARLNGLLNTQNVSIKFLEEEKINCELLIENRQLHLILKNYEKGYLTREDLN